MLAMIEKSFELMTRKKYKTIDKWNTSILTKFKNYDITNFISLIDVMKNEVQFEH